MSDKLLIEKKEGVGLITVNRPEARNALDAESFRGLLDAFEALDADDEVRVIIVTGAGEKSFVSGADVRMLKERGGAETFRAFNSRAFQRIENICKPTIAAINGYAFGGGLELAMACDLRLCSSTAKLGQTELNLGFLPGAGGTQRLTRLVGLARAKELIFTGRVVLPDEALRIGLVNEVVAPNELMARAFDLASAIARKSPFILGLAKLAVNRGQDCSLDVGLALERLGQTAAFGTEDHLEGIDAFLEKRPANFKGR